MRLKNKIMDKYNIQARIYPVIIGFFPIIALGLCYTFEFKSTLHFLSSIEITGVLVFLFSQLGRDMGKKKEKDLWRKWNGCPSVQLLRLRDNSIDVITKNRYHQKLNGICPVPKVPTFNMEKTHPEKADDVYVAWTRHLISQTRDPRKFSLLFKENISYGFRRNLWGIKNFSIILILACLVGNYLFWMFRWRTYSPSMYPVSFLYSTVLLLFILLFWLLIIRSHWIRPVAFSYAERLLEATEQL